MEPENSSSATILRIRAGAADFGETDKFDAHLLSSVQNYGVEITEPCYVSRL